MSKQIVVLAFLFLWSGAVATAQSPQNFRVTFDGIIMHDLEIGRAFVVRGTPDMPHEAVLVTPADISIDKMRAAIGKQQPFSCNLQTCSFRIDGVSLRVGTSDASVPPPGSLNVMPNFKNYTPHMQCVTQGTLYPILAKDKLPSGPVAASFELIAGDLDACTFPGTGFFFPDYDRHSDRKFTDKVTLDGNVGNAETATLQVRSYLTQGEWVAVPLTVTATKTLLLTVRNHPPPAQSGKMSPSNLHFAINGQLIYSNVPFPSVCPTGGHGDDPNCPAAAQYARRPPANGEACLPPTLTANDNDNDCPTMSADLRSLADWRIYKKQANAAKQKRSAANMQPLGRGNLNMSPFDGGNLDDIIGCSNSQWP